VLVPQSAYTVVIPKEGQIRFAEQASRSTEFAIFWAADSRNKSLLDLKGYLTKLELRVTWPSFGNTMVFQNHMRVANALLFTHSFRHCRRRYHRYHNVQTRNHARRSNSVSYLQLQRHPESSRMIARDREPCTAHGSTTSPFGLTTRFRLNNTVTSECCQNSLAFDNDWYKPNRPDGQARASSGIRESEVKCGKGLKGHSGVEEGVLEIKRWRLEMGGDVCRGGGVARDFEGGRSWVC
jgi:hypothetical protein